MNRGRNPLLLVLGVCGGCALIGIVVVLVLGAVGFNKVKQMGTAMQATKADSQQFMANVKSHNYTAAASHVAPESQARLSAATLKSMEQAVEKKLGPMQSWDIPQQSTNSSQATPGQAAMDLVYIYTVKFKKGAATARVTYHSDNAFAPQSHITDFSITPEP